MPEPKRSETFLEDAMRQWGDTVLRLDKAAAQTLAKARLVLTATFNDGSTETKTYVIQPIEDFDQQCTAYWETSYEWSEKYEQETSSDDAPSTEHPEKPPLYTITEVS